MLFTSKSTKNLYFRKIKIKENKFFGGGKSICLIIRKITLRIKHLKQRNNYFFLCFILRFLYILD